MIYPVHSSSIRPRRRAAIWLGILLSLALVVSVVVTMVMLNNRQAPPTSSTRMWALLYATKETNYLPARNGWTYMWSRFDAAEINADFAQIRSLGFNTVRILIQARSGAFDYPSPTPDQLHRLSQVVQMAAAHQLQLHLTLFGLWGAYSDIAGSERWATAIVKPLAGNRIIRFIELQNELDVDAPDAMDWARTMIPFLQQMDGAIPVTVSEYGVGRMQQLTHALYATPPDFWDFHTYQLGGVYAVLSQVKAIVRNQPLFIGETGYSTDSAGARGYPGSAPTLRAQEAEQDYYYRTMFFAAQALKLPAPAPWTFSDFDSDAIPPMGPHAAAESSFGYLRLDGSRKPAAVTLASLLAGRPVVTSFNNGFEQSDGAGLPTIWRMIWGGSTQTSGNLAWDGAVAHTGEASARIANSASSADGSASFFVTPVQPIEPGHAYTVAAWARGETVTGKTYLSFVWLDSAGKTLSERNSLPFPPGTFLWTQRTLTATAPLGAVELEIHLNSDNNTGIVWFDDVSFSPIA